jgi:DNA-binding LacI/PurR family transcriptional regulator
MAVVGFDDLRVFNFPLPTLTTVRAPIEQTAAQAARMLIDCINQQPVETQVLMPTELVIRSSCGCAYQPDPLDWD